MIDYEKITQRIYEITVKATRGLEDLLVVANTGQEPEGWQQRYDDFTRAQDALIVECVKQFVAAMCDLDGCKGRMIGPSDIDDIAREIGLKDTKK